MNTAISSRNYPYFTPEAADSSPLPSESKETLRKALTPTEYIEELDQTFQAALSDSQSRLSLGGDHDKTSVLGPSQTNPPQARIQSGLDALLSQIGNGTAAILSNWDQPEESNNGLGVGAATPSPGGNIGSCSQTRNNGQGNFPVSQGALSWQAAGKAWQRRSFGIFGDDHSKAAKPATKLEDLLKEIEGQQRATQNAGEGASCKVNDVISSSALPSRRQGNASIVSEPAGLYSGLQLDAQSTALQQQEQQPPAESSRNSYKGFLPGVDAMASNSTIWRQPQWQPMKMDYRYATSAKDILQSICAWELLEARESAVFTRRIQDVLCTLPSECSIQP